MLFYNSNTHKERKIDETISNMSVAAASALSNMSVVVAAECVECFAAYFGLSE